MKIIVTMPEGGGITGKNRVKYKHGETLSLPEGVAQSLIEAGRAKAAPVRQKPETENTGE